ncbi:MAG: alpha/beta hydrolase, partial [Nitrososphaerales archaeon]
MKTTRSARSLLAIIPLGVAGVATLVILQYRYDIRQAVERLESEGSQVIDTPCGSIEYAREGSGPHVLVVHGNGGGFDQGLGLARAYLGKGFDVVAPSRFGYLRTPLPRGASPALQADAYACLLDALGIQQASLFTSSAGVTSAVQFALRHPDRLTALVLHSPNAPGRVEMALPPKAVLSALFHSNFAYWVMITGLRRAMEPFVGVPKGWVLTPEQEAAVTAALKEVVPVSARGDGMIFDTFVSNPEINSGYPFASIRAPTLVVSAVDDPEAPHANARVLAAAIPGARLLAVADGGHLMLG